MQPWRSRGTSCLFCSFRPLFRQTTRGFTTTPIFERKASKRSRKKAPFSHQIGRGALNQDLPSLISICLSEFKKELSPSDVAAASWEKFEHRILQAAKIDIGGKAGQWGSLRHLKASLQQIYTNQGVMGLKRELKYLFQADEITAKYSVPNLADQEKVADLRFPAEWYPPARAIQRTIHLHVGPTNSGKTYHALKRLECSKRGFYAGPLRLLAQEVYARFKTEGIPTGLVTGDEVRLPEDGEPPQILSNTVEMVSLAKDYEVGVIDEIQMIADPKRGWAWTRAFLGTRCAELHLCGETRTVPLIRKLVALTGDTLEIHRYERLNPLEVMPKSLKGDLRSLQKGDCVVSFSRVGIHALKSDIEKASGRRAAIVYGGLPAEIRTQQASLFNDPNNDYDYLVASDAIGMGLNLKCKRIIFETLVKKLPIGLSRLSIPEIKQIAGRAGRYRAANETGKEHESKEPNVGLVTCLEDVDLPYIQQALAFEPPPLTAAGVAPPDPVIQQFSNYFPTGVSFQYLYKRLLSIAQVSPLFFMCDPASPLEAGEIIDSVRGLGIDDQLVFMAAPLHCKQTHSRNIARAFAKCVANHHGGRLLDIPELNLEILEQPVSGNKEYLHELENLHKALILYLWLSYRLGGIFTDRTLATHVKELVEERMVRALTEFSANRKLRKDASLRRQIALKRQIKEQKRIISEASDAQPTRLGSPHTDSLNHGNVAPTATVN